MDVRAANQNRSLSEDSDMGSPTTRYVVITPVRDEEGFIGLTIECMVQQSVRPTEWVIVNDGSTDKTGAIIDDYAKRYPWIRAYHRANRGFRKAGGGVVEAFNDGYRSLACHDWEFIAKFDGDLSFDSRYFERCFEYFLREPKLGLGGGGIYHEVNGEDRLEACPKFHVRGATKIYRRACWEGIGGFWPAPGWDTFDEVKANRLGWTTRTFDDLRLKHHRMTGTADGVWAGLVKNGRANYVCGYHPLFMLGKCAQRAFRRPYIMGSAALFYGFVTGYVKGIPQVNDPVTISYLRHQQLMRMCGQATIWR
jgi:poly-beta-1,6-N-acetyl-D-glucosamine synthase